MALGRKPGFKDLENLRRQLASGGFDLDKIKREKFVSFMLVKDPKFFAEALWWSIKEAEDGWNQKDEVEWDHCIETVMKMLTEHPGYEKLEGGTVKIKFVAAVAIATK